MKLNKRWRINRNLLPFKLHFFFAFGAFAGVMPFMPIIAKQIGINATAVGVVYSMIPLFIFLFNPIIGCLVDYFQNIKVFLAFLLISSSATYFSVLSVPKIEFVPHNASYIRVFNCNDSHPLINISIPFERSCLEDVLAKDIHCKLGFENKMSVSNNTESILTDLTNQLDVTYSVNQSENSNKEADDKHWVTFYVEDVPLNDTNYKLPLKVFQCSPTIQHCSTNYEVAFVFSTSQFWAFIIISFFGGITGASAITLSSVGCCERLGDRAEDYGRQRLFGTISWGLVCSLAGFLNDIPKSTGKSFLPGFYLMGILMAIDIVIVYVIYIPKANSSPNMCKDLGKIFCSKQILIFSFGVAFTGFINSIIAVYEFWFLEDMGANRTLLGLTVAIQCFVGEVPFLFFSGWLVKKLGHFLCLVGVFFGFALRLLLYSVLKDPWFVLPIDILHGLTFGLYHGTMTSFAKVNAPKGLEATLLGMFGGLCDGLGFGLGSFVGGFGLDNLGPRRTFLSASILSMGCLLAFLVASFVFRATPMRKTAQVAASEKEEVTNIE